MTDKKTDRSGIWVADHTGGFIVMQRTGPDASLCHGPKLQVRYPEFYPDEVFKTRELALAFAHTLPGIWIDTRVGGYIVLQMIGPDACLCHGPKMKARHPMFHPGEVFETRELAQAYAETLESA